MSWTSKRLKAVAPARRIVTAHDSTDTDGSNVVVFDESLPLPSILDDGARIRPLYVSKGCPTTNTHTTTPEAIEATTKSVKGVIVPGGSAFSVTDLAPGFKVGYHRTSSVDHNIFIEGSATLLTPLPDGSEKRTEVRAGDVVVQRGTLHGWEAGPRGARWYTVLTSAHPVKIGDDGKELEDVEF